MSPSPPRRPGSDDDVEKVKSDAEKAGEQISKGVEIDKVKSDKESETKFKSDKEFETKSKAEKELEKVKRDNEKLPEKIKPEKEHKELEKIKADKELDKLKPEKEQKFEGKELEKVKRDNEKLPEKIKPEKEQKFEGKESEKIKDDKEQFEKSLPEKQSEAESSIQGFAGGLDPAALLAHADSLEQSGRQLRHFIERSMRPDLSTGALRNEEDQQDEPDPEQDDD
jgi:hypothetical protein